MTFTLRPFNSIARGIMCPNKQEPMRFVSTTVPRLSATPQKPYFGNPPFNLFTKSRIADIFARYCPNLDPQPFHVVAQVYPMRVNNYVLENLIDWSVSRDILRLGAKQRDPYICGIGQKSRKIQSSNWYFLSQKCFQRMTSMPCGM